MDSTQDRFEGPEIAELRQYRTKPGRRDHLIHLFEHAFVEEQRRLGMTVLGWYREPDDPDRFTWLRAFPDHAIRGSATDAFYRGDVWLRHREEANACLDDSDDVFMLRLAWPGSGMCPVDADSASFPDADLVIVPIDPTDLPALIVRLHNLSVTSTPGFAAYATAPLPNNYPRLPIREDAFVLVTVIPVLSEDPATRTRDVLAQINQVRHGEIVMRRLHAAQGLHGSRNQP